jgi:hypothetical protein
LGFAVNPSLQAGVLAILATLCAGCLVRHHYEYFEPSGFGTVISRPARAPRNAAIKKLGAADLTVRSRVNEAGRVQLFLYLDLPPGSRVRFTSDRVRILNGFEDEIRVSWMEWTLLDGVGSKKSVPFDAPLKPQSFPGKPVLVGVEDMGQYESTFELPERYSGVRQFTMILPAPVGGSPLRVSFARKTADFLDLDPLQ